MNNSVDDKLRNQTRGAVHAQTGHVSSQTARDGLAAPVWHRAPSDATQLRGSAHWMRGHMQKRMRARDRRGTGGWTPRTAEKKKKPHFLALKYRCGKWNTDKR